MVANAQICPIDMHDVDIGNGYALYIGAAHYWRETLKYFIPSTQYAVRVLGYMYRKHKNFPKKQLWENEFFEAWYKIDYYASVFFNCLEGKSAIALRKSATFYPPDQNQQPCK